MTAENESYQSTRPHDKFKPRVKGTEGTKTISEVPTVYGNFTAIFSQAERDRIQAPEIARAEVKEQTPSAQQPEAPKPKPRDPLDSFSWGVYSGIRKLADNTLGD